MAPENQHEGPKENTGCPLGLGGHLPKAGWVWQGEPPALPALGHQDGSAVPEGTQPSGSCIQAGCGQRALVVPASTDVHLTKAAGTKVKVGDFG